MRYGLHQLLIAQIYDNLRDKADAIPAVSITVGINLNASLHILCWTGFYTDNAPYGNIVFTQQGYSFHLHGEVVYSSVDSFSQRSRRIEKLDHKGLLY